MRPPPSNGSPTSQKARQWRTGMAAWRRLEPWTPEEDEQLTACDTADDLEAFAVRWGRTFAACEQRRRRPQSKPGASV